MGSFCSFMSVGFLVVPASGLWNNRLREAVVNRDVFVFEYFIYSKY